MPPHSGRVPENRSPGLNHRLQKSWCWTNAHVLESAALLTVALTALSLLYPPIGTVLYKLLDFVLGFFPQLRFQSRVGFYLGSLSLSLPYASRSLLDVFCELAGTRIGAGIVSGLLAGAVLNL
ncbi:MAG: hypothetical protein M1829_004101 [Trizodia sp. TS-e1964]|nr:MAG: hypothetical protein M1829_004101 [Trizodia sp. TS-e1964]